MIAWFRRGSGKNFKMKSAAAVPNSNEILRNGSYYDVWGGLKWFLYHQSTDGVPTREQERMFHAF